MDRTHWLGALFLVLACIGLAWGQAPTAGNTPAAEKPKERFITVKELEKPGLRCKVLKTWNEPDGTKAYLVQAVTTLEMLTIVEAGPLTTTQQGGVPVKAVSTRIFHWGKSEVPPPGAPNAPATALVLGQPLKEPLPPSPSPVASKPAVPTTTPPLTKPASPPPSAVASKPASPAPSTVVKPDTPPLTKPASSFPPAVANKPASPAPSSLAKPATPPLTKPASPPPAAVASKPAPSTPSTVVKPATPPLTRPTNSLPAAVVSKPTTSTPSAVAKPAPGPVTRPASPPPAAVASKPTPPATSTVVKSATPRPNAVETKPSTPAAPTTLWPPAFATGPKPATDDKESKKPLAGAPLPPPSTAKKPAPTPAKPVETQVAVRPLPPSADVVPEVKMPASGTTISKSPPARPTTNQPIATTRGSETKAGPVQVSPLSEAKQAGRTVTRLPADTPPTPQDMIEKPKATAEPAKTATVESVKKAAVVPAKTATVESVKKAAVEPAKPAEWRQSWGKSDASKGTAVAKTDKPAASNPPSATSVKQPDPLRAPDAFTKINLEDKETKPTAAKPKVEVAKPAPPTVANLASDKAPGRPLQTILSTLTKGSASRKEEKDLNRPVAPVVKTEEKKAVVAATSGTSWKDKPPASLPTVTPPTSLPPMQPSIPLGMNSVAAVGSPELEETPLAVASSKGTPVAVTEPRKNAFMDPRCPVQPGTYPPALTDRGAPPGMANAFTPSGSARPIPADFGTPGPVANAFTPNGINDRRQPHYPQGQLVAVNPAMAVPPKLPLPASASLGQEHAGVPQLLATLKDSLYPSQREWAAEKLAAMDWQNEPRIVSSLTKAAKEDPAPTVRAGCVRCLAQMRLNTMPVVSVIQALQKDSDPRVRHEVEQALAVLGVPSRPGDAPIQPASMK